ncbi:hypothetical protein AciX8_3538 [Granulicella mallensis MP5ACTX8]|jgi:hypothetical protein|uniref:Uncharacterized protein n=1 Tax=Granulicella mallensis (strain ATCC BAA-1857 / DSM 23137 / MP5ACTX8) TaxID=682795 RepID=G8NXC6_GRAMM|nr:hypothetical protein AciX8_3538 [Granulicella mallensis MP5ACTX8]
MSLIDALVQHLATRFFSQRPALAFLTLSVGLYLLSVIIRWFSRNNGGTKRRVAAQIIPGVKDASQ